MRRWYRRGVEKDSVEGRRSEGQPLCTEEAKEIEQEAEEWPEDIRSRRGRAGEREPGNKGRENTTCNEGKGEKQGKLEKQTS